MTDIKSKGLGPKDKSPATHGFGSEFHHVEPQRRMPCVLGDMLVPASADDIPPVAPGTLAAVDAALELLASYLTDRDVLVYLGASYQQDEAARDAAAYRRLKGALRGILREAAAPAPRLYVWLVAAETDAGAGCQAIGFMESGQILIQSKIHQGQDPQTRLAAVANVTDWMRKHRPTWDIRDDNMTVWPCPFDARKMIAQVVR